MKRKVQVQASLKFDAKNAVLQLIRKREGPGMIAMIGWQKKV
jgi:hypothetical protein